MQDKNAMDILFRQRFEEFEPDFDKLETWDNLEPKLSRRNKPGWLLFVLPVFILLSVTVAFTSDNWERSANQNANSLVITTKNDKLHTKLNQNNKESMEQKLSLESNSVQKGAGEMTAGIVSPTNKIYNSAYNGKVALTKEVPLETFYSAHSPAMEIHDHAASVNIPEIHRPSNEHLSQWTPGSISFLLEGQRPDFKLPPVKKRRKWSECKVEERSSFYISPYVSGLYPFQSLAPVADQDAYAEKWKRYDDVLPGYAAGLLVGYEHPSGFNIETGLEWQQAFERLLFYQMVTETIKVYSDSAYYWENEQGEIEYFGDTITSTTTYERKVQSLKQHRIWSIPVGLGYTFDFSRMRLGVQAGAIFHLDHTFKGRVYTPEGKFEYLVPGDKGQIYDPHLGISWFGSVRLYFLPSDNVEWYIAPGFRFNGSSWLNADTGLELLNQFGELKVGVRIFL